jgi:hydroxyacylglutathione hydrolase
MKISDGVYFIEGQDELFPDSHTYIIGEPSSEDLSMVDVGLTRKGNDKVQSIKKLGIELSAIKRIVLTHTHLDHIGCLAEVRREIPGAEIWIHQAEADPLEQGDDRGVYGMNDFERMSQAEFGLKPGDFTFAVDRKLEGGEALVLGGMDWEVLHIPGHSTGGIALYNRPARILIPGDVIYADHSIGRFDLHGANPAQLRQSLMRLAELEVDILLPGHNRTVKGLPPGYVLKTAKMWEGYLS